MSIKGFIPYFLKQKEKNEAGATWIQNAQHPHYVQSPGKSPILLAGLANA
jgi:hypothetical protein